MKIKILLGTIAVILLAVLFIKPIPQDMKYHQFADQKTIADIPNMWNVLSNIPFVLVGILGCFSLRHLNPNTISNRHKTIFLTFYVGIILTGFGSIYYHFAPSNETLLWDRLPMAITFMAFFSFVISIHISELVGTFLLWPLVAIGVTSVLYWGYTEEVGRGDLRFYAIIQFLPMILIPIIISMFPQSVYKQSYIWIVIAIYVAAKLSEHFDHQLYDSCGISGHTFKHVIASLSGIAFLQAIRSINIENRG